MDDRDGPRSGPAMVSWQTAADREWFYELDLDPSHQYPAMGLRRLRDRPWLLRDDLFAAELEYKIHLLNTRGDDVFGAGEQALEPAEEALNMICVELFPEGGSAAKLAARPGDLHPLDRAGRSVQEDLCLMQPAAAGWVLAAASLCFPSRWRLADKLGQTMPLIHQKVDGYAEVLSDRVDSFFDSLATGDPERIVWRRNWFLRADPTLFQPDRKPEPLVPAADVMESLFIRSERQTLRLLPTTGWILFTIRTQHARLAHFLNDQEIRLRFSQFLASADDELVESRGISPAQRKNVLAVLE